MLQEEWEVEEKVEKEDKYVNVNIWQTMLKHYPSKTY